MIESQVQHRRKNPAVITDETITYMNKWKTSFLADAQTAQRQITANAQHEQRLFTIDEARSMERVGLMTACLNNARCYSLLLSFANMHLEEILHTNTGNFFNEMMGYIDLQFSEPRLPDITKAALIKFADQLVDAQQSNRG